MLAQTTAADNFGVCPWPGRQWHAHVHGCDQRDLRLRRERRFTDEGDHPPDVRRAADRLPL